MTDVSMAVDQEARDLVREVGAEIKQHIVLCTEREKRREQVDDERERRHEDFLESLRREVAAGMTRLEERVVGMQRAYESAASDQNARLGELGTRHSNAVNTLAASIQQTDKKVDEKIEADRQSNSNKFREIYNRLWAIIWTVGGALILILLGVIGFLVAPYFTPHHP